MKKRITLGFLCVVLILTTFIGCIREGDDSTTTSKITGDPSVTSDTERLYPDLPDDTFDGYKYRFYVSDLTMAGSKYRPWEDIWFEEAGSEPISVAVYNRNSVISEKYDIEISMTTEQYLTYETNLVKNVIVNDDFADVLISLGDNICRLYTQDVFYNLRDVPYLDFDMPWWDSKAADSFTLGGYMPFGISDLTVNDKGVTGAIFFNKQIAEDLNLGDLYQLVKDDEWNFDKMKELGLRATKDMDGLGVMDENDRYGILGDDGMVYQLFAAAGARHVSKDSEGMPEITFNSKENITMIQDYLTKILFNEDLTYNTSHFVNTAEEGGNYCHTMFANNLGLFLMRPLNMTETFRSTMESNFGILPLPKYYENQETYYSPVQCYGGSVISVPNNSVNPERTGIILEALSAESTYVLIPAFYETVLKDKNTRDDESKEMLDIILDTRIYDVGVFYSLAGFSNDFVLITGEQVSIFGIQKTTDIASFYAKRQRTLNSALNNLIKIIEEWNDD